MAIAALVLGIIALVLFFTCGLGIVVGIVAVILGIIARGKAKETGKGAGQALAGIVLGALGVIGGIAFIVLITVGINRASHRVGDAFGKANSDNYDLVTKTCEKDSNGSVTFSGTIKNTANRDLDFTIKTEIRDSSNGSLADSPSTLVYTTKGDTVNWEVTGSVPAKTGQVECKVSEVDNFGNF